MAAYMIIEVEVTDQDLHEEYRQRLSPVIAQLGGRRLMNTGTPRNMAGDWNLR